MKTIGFAWIILTVATLACGIDFDYSDYEYSGQFEEVYWDGKPCDQVFQIAEYRLRLNLGESAQPAEVSFSGFDQEGFLHQKKLIGNISEGGIMTAITSIPIEEGILKLTLEGQRDETTFFFDLKAAVFEKTGKVMCRGRGTFTAFTRKFNSK